MKNFIRRALCVHRRRLVTVNRCYNDTATSSSEAENTGARFSRFVPQQPKDQEQLLSYLARSAILHMPGKMIVIEKPFGLAAYGYNLRKKGGFELEEENVRDEVTEKEPMSIHSVLPYLARAYGEENLMMVRSTPRYVSGAVALACTNKMVERIDRCRVRANVARDPDFKVLALCVGVPQKQEHSQLFGGKSISVKGNPMIVESEEIETSRQRRWSRGIVVDQLSYRVLGSNAQCSLVELTCTKWQRYLPRLFLAANLLPVVGDVFFEQRIAYVLGAPVLVPPTQASKRNQFIPPELLKALHISPNEYHRLPLCMHVHEWTFKSLFKKKEDIVISIPPPPHFARILDEIGLLECAKSEFKAIER